MQEDQTHGLGLLFKSTAKPKLRNIPGPSSSGLLKDTKYPCSILGSQKKSLGV